jgi:hypothetical protein
MTTLRCGVLVLFCSVAVPWPAYAVEIILDGEAACLSIGGAWSGGTCTFDRLIVPAGMYLRSEVAVSAGETIIEGYLEVVNDFEPTRSLVNRGTLYTAGITVSTAQMFNWGWWWNSGGFYSDTTVSNEWIFENGGVFETRLGAFLNRGYTFITSGGLLSNPGGLIVNEGFIGNYGNLVNTAGSMLDNAGVIDTYDATMLNYGTVLGRCGSVFRVEFPWEFGGNPVEYDPCQGGDAVARLRTYVLSLGQKRMLSRDDTKALTSLLAKAGKRLQAFREAEAVELLQTFMAEVGRRTRWPLDFDLFLRANRALEILVTTSPVYPDVRLGSANPRVEERR